ncbi:MAG: transglutaminase family protein [Flavobacteriales bacterium]
MAAGMGPDNDRNDAGTGLIQSLVMFVVAMLVAAPVFVLVYPHVPLMHATLVNGWRLELAGLFLVILIGCLLLVRRFRAIVYGFAVLVLAALSITSLLDIYGFRDLRGDYRTMLRSLRAGTVQMPIEEELVPFADSDALRECIDYQDRTVRSFAVRSATTYFTDVPVEGDEYTLIQAFSIFKVINSTWIYVSDPKGGEYFAKASESVDLLAGDCDDHAILMAACIKAIGGEVRLVRTTGHIYPEMKVGDAKAMERAATLIRKQLFPEQAGRAALFYHTDAKGDRWINLDYTRNYPGGEVMNETIKGILPV